MTLQFHGIDPHVISRALGVGATGSSYSMESEWNWWSLYSDLISDDVNEHIRDLLELLEGKEDRIRAEWNPQFCVTWQGEGLRPVGGQIYDADVLAGIARCGAVLVERTRKENE